MRFNDLAAEIEADTCTVRALRAVRLVMLDAKEFLEHPLTELWGNARTGVRLKPYLDAGAIYTPPTFALYPALIAAAFAILVVGSSLINRVVSCWSPNLDR